MRLFTILDILNQSGIPATEPGPDWETAHVYRTNAEGPHLSLEEVRRAVGYRYTIRTWSHYDGDLVLRWVDATPAEAIAFALSWWEGEAAELAAAQAV